MKNRIDHPIKIAIVGIGNVGATFAYALLGSSLASQIVLIDADALYQNLGG
jgi:L-lactate dehydrogenase